MHCMLQCSLHIGQDGRTKPMLVVFTWQKCFPLQHQFLDHHLYTAVPEGCDDCVCTGPGLLLLLMSVDGHAMGTAGFCSYSD